MPPKLYSHYVNMDNGRRAIRSELAGYCLMLAVSGQENRRELRLLRPTTHPPNMPEIGMLSWPTIFVYAELRKLLGKRQPVAIYHTGNVRWSALADQLAPAMGAIRLIRINDQHHHHFKNIISSQFTVASSQQLGESWV